MNGQLTSIQPTVPPIRTAPNCLAGSFRFANAMEFETESVGT